MGNCLSQKNEEAKKVEQKCTRKEKTREVNTPNGNHSYLQGTFNFEFLRRGGVIGENDLHRFITRMPFSGASRLASLYTEKGKKEVNQDDMLVWEVS